VATGARGDCSVCVYAWCMSIHTSKQQARGTMHFDQGRSVRFSGSKDLLKIVKVRSNFSRS